MDHPDGVIKSVVVVMVRRVITYYIVGTRLYRFSIKSKSVRTATQGYDVTITSILLTLYCIYGSCTVL